MTSLVISSVLYVDIGDWDSLSMIAIPSNTSILSIFHYFACYLCLITLMSPEQYTNLQCSVHNICHGLQERCSQRELICTVTVVRYDI